MTDQDWRDFFRKSNDLPLDKPTERRMIDLFKDDRTELNRLLVQHNTLAADNLAEVYWKRYEKYSPTRWHDFDDFRQLSREGLAVAADRFDLNSGNKFITYATWWMMNRVRRPSQEKGAKVSCLSFDGTIGRESDDSQTTLGDACTADQISPDYVSSSILDASTTPVDQMDSRLAERQWNFYRLVKSTPVESLSDEEAKSAIEMAARLVQVVEQAKLNPDGETDRQILLYTFRNLFRKCAGLPCRTSLGRKLQRLADQAA